MDEETSAATIQSESPGPRAPADGGPILNRARACCIPDCRAADVAVVAFWLVCFAIFFAGLLVDDWLLVVIGTVLISVGALVLLVYFRGRIKFRGTSAPDFKPGTNAQRHRLIQAKHGSKHGSGRLSSIFGSSGSHSSSGSVGAPAPAGPHRAELPPALTWRASPPGRPPKAPSAQV